jgi:hypothetical protein
VFPESIFAQGVDVLFMKCWMRTQCALLFPTNLTQRKLSLKPKPEQAGEAWSRRFPRLAVYSTLPTP